MKVYVNKTKEQKMITFADGSSVFLKSGQKVTSEQDVKYVEKGIVVRDGVKAPVKKKAVPSIKKQEQENKGDE